MIVCNHGIAGPCPICRSDRRADIAERELRETAEELERVRVRLTRAEQLLSWVPESETGLSRMIDEHLGREREEACPVDAKLTAIEDAVAFDPDTAPESLVRSVVRVIKEVLRTPAPATGEEGT